MKTNVNVAQKANGLWRVTYRGKTVSDNLRDEQTAQLNAHHFRHAPTTFKRLGFKGRGVAPTRSKTSFLARPFWGVKAEIAKAEKGWTATVIVDDRPAETKTCRTRELAAEWVRTFGNEKLTTRNMLNPEAGDIEISRSEKGGCTDPGTERYWSM